jgi:multidrug efflux pump subunit AcrA (membrane-fusion protein)
MSKANEEERKAEAAAALEKQRREAEERRQAELAARAKQQQEAEQRQQAEEAERQLREREAEERRRAAELAALAKQQQEAEQRQQAEEAERQLREREAEERRLDEERRRDAEVAAAEEQGAKQRLEDWLRQEKFTGVNDKRKTMMKTKFPLHSAVKRKDVETIQLLLRFGADPTNKDSNGLTPKDLAEKSNKDGSLDAVVQALARVSFKGCAGGA